MKRLLASAAVAAAVAFALPTSAAAAAPAKFDCNKAAAAWTKKNPKANAAAKKAESLKLAERGSCNIKAKSL